MEIAKVITGETAGTAKAAKNIPFAISKVSSDNLSNCCEEYVLIKYEDIIGILICQ